MTNLLTTPQIASLEMRTRSAGLHVQVSVTPTGLLAIGGLVAAILLCIPPIIRASGEARTAED